MDILTVIFLGITAAMALLGGYIAVFRKPFDKKFDKIDERFDKLSEEGRTAHDKIGSNIEKLREEIIKTGKDVSKIEGILSQMKKES